VERAGRYRVACHADIVCLCKRRTATDRRKPGAICMESEI
jgi:hypothetical protein